MTVYIDTDYKCHTSYASGLTPVETDAFTGKCPAYIEGYRLVPDGSTWVRADGATFRGEMLAPWKPWEVLDAAQREYERGQITEYESALSAIEEALSL